MPPTEKDLEIYVVYRNRIRELIHLILLFRDLNENENRGFPDNVLGDTAKDFAGTLRTATLGWLSSLVDKDKRALNVFLLCVRLFPSKREEIEDVKTQITPHLKRLRDFRNNVAFHASKRVSEHLRVRQAILGRDMAAATDRFLELCITLLRDENAVPGLTETLEKYGLA